MQSSSLHSLPDAIIVSQNIIYMVLKMGNDLQDWSRYAGNTGLSLIQSLVYVHCLIFTFHYNLVFFFPFKAFMSAPIPQKLNSGVPGQAPSPSPAPSIPSSQGNLSGLEKTLKDGLRQLYSASSDAKDLQTLQGQLKSLEGIMTGDIQDATIKDEISRRMNNVRQQMSSIRQNVKRSEEAVIRAFQNFVSEALEPLRDEVEQSKKACKELVEEECLKCKTEQTDNVKAIEERMERTLSTKMTKVEAEQKIREMDNQVKEELKNLIKEKIDAVRQKNGEIFKRLADDTKQLKSSEHLDTVRRDISASILQQVRTLLDQHNASRDELTANEIKRLIDQEFATRSEPDRLTEILTDLPAWKAIQENMTRMSDTLAKQATAEESAGKEAVVKLEEKMNEQATRLHETRRWLDNLRESGTKISESSLQQAQLGSLQTSIQELTQDVKLIEKTLEHAQLGLAVNSSAIASLKANSGSASPNIAAGRKRPRVMDETREANEEGQVDSSSSSGGGAAVGDQAEPSVDAAQLQTLTDKVTLLESNVNQLLSHLNPLRSTVLNSQFPQRLENHFVDIQNTLYNHEMALAVLINPIASEQNGCVDIPPLEHVQAAMPDNSKIEAIAAKAVEQATRPLLARIAQLEQKLASKDGV